MNDCVDVRPSPAGWEKCRVEDLLGGDGLFVDGDWIESKDQDAAGSVRLIQLADIGDNQFKNKSARFLTSETAQELGCTFLQQGDVLISRLPDPLGRACLFPLDGTMRFVTAVDVSIVRLSKLIDRQWFAYFFNSPAIRHEIDAYRTGSTRARISRKNLARVEFRLPPAAEQCRIVAKIEALFSELDKGLESLTTARTQLKTYRQALLKHAFQGKLTEQWRKDHADELETADQLLARIREERVARYQRQLEAWKAEIARWEAAGKLGKKLGKPRAPKNLLPPSSKELADVEELPREWAVLRLGELNVDVFDGPFGSHLTGSDYTDSGVRIVRLENIGDYAFDDAKRSYVSEEKYASIKRHTVYPGDAIFSSFLANGTRVALMPVSISFAINKADCFCVRFHGKTALNTFMGRYLSTRQVYHQLESYVHGATRPRINTKQLQHVIVPVCGVAEQSAVIAALEVDLSQVDQLEQTIATALQQAKTLRQSILKRAFEGKLVPQDPNEEPAAELLARIRGERAAQPKRGRRQARAEA